MIEKKSKIKSKTKTQELLLQSIENEIDEEDEEGRTKDLSILDSCAFIKKINSVIASPTVCINGCITI